jgi:uncharacterized protein (DUF983 family)
MTRPGLTKMLWRGVRRRCPWCGGRSAFFTGWFSKQERCRTCGIGWRRGYEGFELGALTISAIVCMGALVSGLGVWMVATSPDIPVLQMIIALGIAAVILPVIVYPFSYTTWQAVDLAMRPPEPGDPDTPSPVL